MASANASPKFGEQEQYADIRSRAQKWLKEAMEHRSVWQLRSYATEAFYKGQIHVSYDRVTRTVKESPIAPENAYNIPKIRTIIRAIKVRLTKNDPRWHVSSAAGDATKEERVAAEKYLRDCYVDLHMKDKLKAVIQHSALKTVGWAFVSWEEGENKPDILIEDPFCIFTSPDGRLEGPVFVGRYMIRAVRRSLVQIRTDPRYKNGKFKETVSKLTADRRQAADHYKDQMLSSEYRVPVDDKDGGAIMYELYCFDTNNELGGSPDNEEEPSEGAPDVPGVKLRRITFVGESDMWVINDEWLPDKKFPLIAYVMESDAGSIYHQSWAYPLIDLNKALNAGYSNRADWFEKFARGRYMNKKGSRMTAINNRNGQIIEYDGQAPQFLQPPSLPESSEVHISETERYMEDIGGAHADAMGRSSSKYQSGKTTASIIAADMENQGEPVDRLQSFLQEVSYRILDLASQYMALHRKNGATIVGANVAMDAENVTQSALPADVLRVKPIDGIQVEIIPGSAFSDIQVREDLMEMKKVGVAIPDDMIIDAYKLGNSAEIIQRFQDEQAAKREAEDGQDAVEAKQAGLENKKMAAGARIVPQEGENHEVHLAVHGQFLASLPPGAKEAEMISNHMRQHEALSNPEALMQGSQQRQIAQQQSQPGPGGYNIPPDMAALQDNRLK